MSVIASIRFEICQLVNTCLCIASLLAWPIQIDSQCTVGYACFVCMCAFRGIRRCPSSTGSRLHIIDRVTCMSLALYSDRFQMCPNATPSHTKFWIAEMTIVRRDERSPSQNEPHSEDISPWEPLNISYFDDFELTHASPQSTWLNAFAP